MNKKLNNIYVLDSIEEDFAIISGDQGKLRVFKKDLPSDAKVGDKIVLILVKEQAYAKENERRAKDLLNEIFGADKA